MIIDCTKKFNTENIAEKILKKTFVSIDFLESITINNRTGSEAMLLSN